MSKEHSRFWIDKDGKAEGPFSAKVIVAMIQCQEVTPTTWLSSDGKEYQHAADILPPSFFDPNGAPATNQPQTESTSTPADTEPIAVNPGAPRKQGKTPAKEDQRSKGQTARRRNKEAESVLGCGCLLLASALVIGFVVLPVYRWVTSTPSGGKSRGSSGSGSSSIRMSEDEYNERKRAHDPYIEAVEKRLREEGVEPSYEDTWKYNK